MAKFKISIWCVWLCALLTLFACSRIEAVEPQGSVKTKTSADAEKLILANTLYETQETAKLLEAEKLFFDLAQNSDRLKLLGAAGLGYVYQSEHFPPHPDYKKAIHWLTIAAEGGESTEQVNLGVLYLDDYPGAPKDLVKAEYWLRKAAEQGNRNATGNMGTVFLKKTPPDKRQAGVWFCRAADMGNLEAMLNCAITLKSDWNDVRDYKRAYRYVLLTQIQFDKLIEPAEKSKLPKDFALRIKSLYHEIRPKLSDKDAHEIEAEIEPLLPTPT